MNLLARFRMRKLQDRLETSEQQHCEASTPEPAIDIGRADLQVQRADLLELLAEYLAEQHGTVLTAKHAEDRFAWMYQGNPHGPAITYLARDRASGTAAGMISLFPRRVASPAGEWLGAMGGDSYVRPAFRRRGIARALHRHALQGMESGRSPVRFMFTAPNAKAAATVAQAGGALVGSVRRFVRPALPWIGFRRAMGVVPLTADVDPRVDDLMATLGPVLHGGAGVVPVRDGAHWAWRYGASPACRQHAALLVRGNQPVALAAWERLPDRLAIVDLVARSRDFHACLRTLFELARERSGCGVLEMRLHSGAPFQGRLRAAGFLARESQPFLVQCPSGFRARQELVGNQGWWFTTGDVDIDAL